MDGAVGIMFSGCPSIFAYVHVCVHAYMHAQAEAFFDKLAVYSLFTRN